MSDPAVIGTPQSSSPFNNGVVPSSPSIQFGTPSQPSQDVAPSSSPTRRHSSDVVSGSQPSQQSRIGTPMRPRPVRRGDVGRSGMPIVSEQTSSAGQESSESSSGVATVVWGTTVNYERARKQFVKFLQEFKLGSNGQSQGYYEKLIQKEAEVGKSFNINVDSRHIHSHDPTLYEQLVAFPEEMVPILDVALNDLADGFGLPPDVAGIQVRIFNLRAATHMRDLDPEDMDKLIAVRGMVTRVSCIIPEIKAAFFQCSACRNSAMVYPNRGRVEEPLRCTNCGAQRTMQIVHNRCLFTNKQLIKLQETPENIPEGEMPHAVNVYAHDNLVDIAKPGDRVEITGVYRATGVRSNPRQRSTSNVFRTYIDLLHIRKMEKGRLAAEAPDEDMVSEFYTPFDEGNDQRQFSEEKEAALRALAKTPNIYEKLVDAFAPSIYEMDDVKKGILCMLFGGTIKEHQDGKLRGDINILLAGDPGVSKSQILQFVHKIAPRGIYTSGKGSSAAGLTAYISKDPDTGEIILESGALVMSDRGVCCIDEFDKMADTTRSILHEVMEQQTLSIAKAGIVCTLNARTSILAASNPKESMYNDSKTITDNLNLPPTLLSRFDLVYVLRDIPNEKADQRLAKHLVALYHKEPSMDAPEVDLATFTDFISFAKRSIKPELSDAAALALVDGYVALRTVRVKEDPQQITATVRQLDSLIRLSEALARMRYSSVVERFDVDEAMRLMKVSTHKAAIDPTTGIADFDILTTGISRAQRDTDAAIISQLRMLLIDVPASIQRRELQMRYNVHYSVEVDDQAFSDALQTLQSEGLITLRQGEVVKRLSSR